MTFPSTMQLIVKIDGVDVTNQVIPSSLTIASVLTAKSDTCSFRLRNASTVVADTWSDVVITDGATKVFGGYVLAPQDEEGIDAELEIDVQCADYAAYFDHIVIVAEYVNNTDASIIAAIFADHLNALGYDGATFVSAIETHPRIRFNRKTIRQCVDMLAEYAGAEWYVDYDKKLHFFVGTENDAPFDVSDNPDYSSAFPYSNMVVNYDATGIVNRVEVVGGFYLSNNATFYIAGTGQDERVILPFRFHAPSGATAIQVWRNDGDDTTPTWTPLTVLIGYVDALAGADHVLYYFSEKVLELQSPWPNLKKAVKITARYEVPLRVRVTDDASYAHYGRWFDATIVDNDIADKGVARLRAKAKLASSAFDKVALSFDVAEPGLRAGESIQVTNALRSLASQKYMIQRVTTKVGVGGKTYSSVNAGIYQPDLIDLLRKLSSAAQPEPLWREDEVLDLLLQAQEVVVLNETSDSISTSNAPYYFSEDPDVAFSWGFGAFTP